MRNAFIQNLVKAAETDERIFLLTGDLGYNLLEPFADQFPDRFINAGVAEQNMTGVAAGLALCGKIVFTYSIANFNTLRCLEQIRNDVCHHNASVKIVSVGAGFHYGSQGYTHFGLEEVAAMRVLPNMSVYWPADPVEAALAVREMIAAPGPGYLRIGGKSEMIHRESKPTTLDKAITVRSGDDLTIAATGPILSEALAAAEELAGKGCSARVISVPVIRPLDVETVFAAAAETGRLLCVEEHAPGGLGTILAEKLIGKVSGLAFRSLTTRSDCHLYSAGADAMRAMQGIDRHGITTAALELLQIREGAGETARRGSKPIAGSPEIQTGTNGPIWRNMS